MSEIFSSVIKHHIDIMDKRSSNDPVFTRYYFSPLGMPITCAIGIGEMALKATFESLKEMKVIAPGLFQGAAKTAAAVLGIFILPIALVVNPTYPNTLVEKGGLREAVVIKKSIELINEHNSKNKWARPLALVLPFSALLGAGELASYTLVSTIKKGSILPLILGQTLLKIAFCVSFSFIVAVYHEKNAKINALYYGLIDSDVPILPKIDVPQKPTHVQNKTQTTTPPPANNQVKIEATPQRSEFIENELLKEAQKIKSDLIKKVSDDFQITDRNQRELLKKIQATPLKDIVKKKKEFESTLASFPRLKMANIEIMEDEPKKEPKKINLPNTQTQTQTKTQPSVDEPD